MAGPSCPDNESNLVAWALSGNYDADQPVLIDASNPARSITRAKATQLVANLAGAFEPDSTVCVHIPNDVLYPILVLAILASGSRWTGTNPSYTQTELEHHFQISKTRCVIASPESLETVKAATKDLGAEVEILVFNDILADRPAACGNGFRTLHDLVDKSGRVPLQFRLRNISADCVATLMSTSGTTGLPKIVPRTHRSLVCETLANEDENATKPYDVRRLYCTPIFHAFSFPEMVINSLRLGQPSYYMKRYDDSFAKKVHDLGITETMAAPPMLLRLANQAEKELEKMQLQSLRTVLCAGAPLMAELRRKFLHVFRCPPRIVQVWGMTEGGWFSSFKYPEDDTTGSVGRAVAGYQVRMSTERSVELANGRLVAELLAKGPQLTDGYLSNPAATAECFTQDGWLKTGDIGHVNDDGKIYLVDRAKDIIKVNGWSVSPAELEAALFHSSDVLDAAALGVGRDVDEHPVAFVVRKRKDVTESQIKEHLLSRLSRYKVAKCEVVFVDAIPKTPSGKTLRKVLRARLAEGVTVYKRKLSLNSIGQCSVNFCTRY